MTAFLLATTLLSAADLGTTLTPEQLAAGWIRLFDGASLFGWKGSGWTEAIQGNLQSSGGSIQTTTRFGKYDVRIRVRNRTGAKGALGLDCVPGGACQQNLPLPSQATEWQWVEGSGSGGTLRLTAENSGVEIAEILAHPLSLHPVNGWVPVKRGPAFFSRTQDGRIHMEGGPAEIVTTDRFSDFVLQCSADIRTLRTKPEMWGGLFLRGDADKMWSGIKVVLDNRFQAKDPKKPVDYGTGGLYGKQPAREIFTRNRIPMRITIIADGPHVSTWVEGYQQTDWTGGDSEIRPSGVIGLQATDANFGFTFSGIRLAEL